MSQVKCCVCLLSTNKYEKIISEDFTKQSYICKLKLIAPEVEWHEGYCICLQCVPQLDQAYKFKKLCLEIESERRSVLLQKPEVFTCFDCGDIFDKKETLTEHLAKHNYVEMTRNKCDNCDKCYSSEKSLRVHIKKCMNLTKRRFSCEICKLELRYANKIIEHCVLVHSLDRKSIKPYSCDKCSMRFISSTNLIQHKKYHEGNRSNICSICGKTFITKSDLTVHEYTHLNRRNYKCEFCEKAFNTNKNLRSHIFVVHTDSSLWKYECNLCNRRFPLKSGYDQHIKRHIGDKKFHCYICEKSFVSRSELQKHLSFHSMVKPFKCESCGKLYKNKNVLQIHLTRIHNIGNAKIPVRLKKFTCEICTSQFCDKQKLERHLRSHDGFKPFLCQQCDKKFSDKCYLKQHMKNLHDINVDEEGFKVT